MPSFTPLAQMEKESERGIAAIRAETLRIDVRTLETTIAVEQANAQVAKRPADTAQGSPS